MAVNAPQTAEKIFFWTENPKKKLFFRSVFTHVRDIQKHFNCENMSSRTHFTRFLARFFDDFEFLCEGLYGSNSQKSFFGLTIFGKNFFSSGFFQCLGPSKARLLCKYERLNSFTGVSSSILRLKVFTKYT